MNAATPNPVTAIYTIASVAHWRIAATMMQSLFMLFGNPEDVAGQHTFLKRDYMLLRTWLRVAEALLRRLLVIEASAFAKPNTPPRLWPRRPRVRKLRHFYPDKPQDWRVSFRCFSHRTLRQAQRDAVCGAAGSVSVSLSLSKPVLSAFGEGAQRPAPKRFFDAWPLAERYEAILRVFNDPIPYAGRLAKRLHALPHRLKEVMRAPQDAHHKVGEEDWAELATHCERAWQPPDSS